MKRAAVLMLVMALCLSLCACGGRGGLSSPGSNPGESPQSGAVTDSGTGDMPKDDQVTDNSGAAPDNSGGDSAPAPEGGSESGENSGASDGPGGDAGQAGNGSGSGNGGSGGSANGGSGQKNTIRESVDTTEKAPENDSTYTYSANGRNITVSYGPGMNPVEAGDVLRIEYGPERFYVDDVTDDYGDSRDPSSFLYDYAYNNAIKWVNEAFGDVTAFDGEVMMKGSGNVVMGYEGTMTCASCETVLAFVKLIQLDGGGYAVATGICDGNNATVFDNIQIR